MASAEISSTGTIAYVWSGSQWIPISGDVDEQSIINSASAAAYSSASTYIDSEINSLSTTDIEEGSNLYFTNQRAIDSASATYILQSEEQNIINTASAAASSYTDSAISSLVDSAPDLLNTLNELAEALGDDENFASNILGTIASASANAITESNNYTDQEISALEVFSNIVTNPETENIQADSNSDTLTFDAGSNIILSASASTDTLNISLDSELTGIDSISTPNFIEFNTSFSPSASLPTGSLYWHEEHQTLHLSLENEVSLDIGQEEHYPPVINNSGVQINRGELVMVAGVQGDKLAIAKAVTDGTVEFDYIIGVAAHDIPDNSDEAVIIKFGYVNPFNTNSYTVGTILYPDPAVAGGLTDVKPNAPGYKVPVAIVTKQGTGGKILVRIANPSTLGESDSNVEFNNLENDDILIYNSASSLWINSPIQEYLNTASAAAYSSASAYVDGEISSLTTDDIEEGSNLYFTEERALNTASTALVHSNHNNITSSYDEENNQIILSALESSASAYAIADTSSSDPEHKNGLLHFNPNNLIFAISYENVWYDLSTAVARSLDGGDSISEFSSVLDAGDSLSEFNIIYDAGTSNV